MTDLSATKSSADEDSLESFTYDLDEVEDEDDDDDIDIDYDWNANKTVAKENKPAEDSQDTDDKDDDDADDHDIDVEYNWDSGKSIQKMEPIDVDQKIDYECSFNMDSPKLLDTPLYSETPNVSTHFTYSNSIEIEYILDLNTTMNKYEDSVGSMQSMEISQLTVTETGDQSPGSTMSAISAISELAPAVSQEGGSLFPFARLSQRPSRSARTMNIISEENNIQAADEKESEPVINYIQYIDSLLATYYAQHNAEDYVNTDDVGKFMAFCTANKISNEDIYNYFTAELKDCTYLDFDETFPFRFEVDINDDHMDNNKKLQLRQKEIYTVIKYCFDNKKVPEK